MKVNAEGAQAPDTASLQMPTEVGEIKEDKDDIDLESVSKPLEEDQW